MGISITCPHGHGETDRGRCFDRAVCLLPPLTCLLCHIPMVLVAEGGQDSVNRKLAALLPIFITSPWKATKINRKRKRRRPSLLDAAWIKPIIPYVYRAEEIVPAPCTVHRLYSAMRRLGSPEVSLRSRRVVIKAAGFVVVQIGGIEQVLRRAA